VYALGSLPWLRGPAPSHSFPGFKGRSRKLAVPCAYCFSTLVPPLGVRTSVSPGLEPTSAPGPLQLVGNSIGVLVALAAFQFALRVACGIAPTQGDSTDRLLPAHPRFEKAASPKLRPLSGGMRPAGQAGWCVSAASSGAPLFPNPGPVPAFIRQVAVQGPTQLGANITPERRGDVTLHLGPRTAESVGARRRSFGGSSSRCLFLDKIIFLPLRRVADPVRACAPASGASGTLGKPGRKAAGSGVNSIRLHSGALGPAGCGDCAPRRSPEQSQLRFCSNGWLGESEISANWAISKRRGDQAT